jgi:hypothetical protein
MTRQGTRQPTALGSYPCEAQPRSGDAVTTRSVYASARTHKHEYLTFGRSALAAQSPHNQVFCAP